MFNFSLTRSLVLLSALLLSAPGCGDDGGGATVVTPDPCEACPDSCILGMCIDSPDSDTGVSQDTEVADTSDPDVEEEDAPDVEEDVAPDVEEDVEEDTQGEDAAADVGPPGCLSDNECEPSEYCDIEADASEGACVEGCRAQGCPQGELCDLETRVCGSDGSCELSEDCASGQVCDQAGLCIEPCAGDDDCEGQFCDLDSGLCEAFECESGADCLVAGFYCRDNACVSGCDAADDCGESQECDEESNTCVNIMCATDDVCRFDQYCSDETGRCEVGCRVDGGCVDGEICDDASRVCREGCRGDDGCIAGDYCEPALLTCVEGCRGSDECLVGTVCSLTEVLEDTEVVLRRRCVDALCEADGDCPDNSYCQLSDGACVEGCRIDGDSDSCPALQFCDSDTRVCLDVPCEESAQCVEGEYCDLDTSACVPGCDSDERCPAGLPCDLATNTCGCQAQSDCEGDEVCSLGMCIPRCEDDLSCGEGFYCDDALGLCIEGCRDDAREPNNTAASALPLAPGSYDLRMCYGATVGEDAMDCFSFNGAIGDEVTAELLFSHAAGDLDVDLYDPLDAVVRRSQSMTDDEVVSHTVEVSGRHVVCVYPQGLGFESEYELSLSIEPVAGCLQDSAEPQDNSCGDAASSAETLQVGVPAFYGDRTICMGDNDHLAVNMLAGQELAVTLERTSISGELDVQILGPDCATVLARTMTFDPIREIAFTAPEDGVYTVRVFGELAGEEGVYDLTMALSGGSASCQDDVVNGSTVGAHGSAAAAAPVTFTRNEALTLDDLSACPMEEDWYLLNLLQAEDRIDLDLSQSSPDLPLQVEILGTDGVTVLATATSESGALSLSSPALQLGAHYVRVSPTASVPEFGIGYSVALFVTTADVCLDDGYEPNNGPDEATLVDTGLYEGSLCQDDGSDWYELLLSQGDRVEATLSYDWSGSGDRPFVFAKLLRPDLSQADFFFDASGGDVETLLNGEAVVGAGEGGSWYIEVPTVATMDYSLDLGVTRPVCDAAPDAFESNESCGEAAGLSLFEEAQGYLCGSSGDEDWFKVSVAANQRLTVDTRFIHSEGNLELEVYDPSETRVGESYSNTDDENIVVGNTTAGDYCIRVFARSTLEQNPYRLITDVE